MHNLYAIFAKLLNICKQIADNTMTGVKQLPPYVISLKKLYCIYLYTFPFNNTNSRNSVTIFSLDLLPFEKSSRSFFFIINTGIVEYS
jgi:hypothetical protein